MDPVLIDVDKLSSRQLHHVVITMLETQALTLQRLDTFMTDLTASVASLQTAVDGVAVRFASQLVPLTEALATAQSALDALQVQDDADKAALAAALADASTAADSINSDVSQLNALGADPSAPVEPVPVEELPPVDTTTDPAPTDGSVDPAPTDTPVDPAPTDTTTTDPAPTDTTTVQDAPTDR